MSSLCSVPPSPAYNFDVIDGVEYTIDVTQPARYDNSGALVAPDARRIRDLTFKGAPVDPNQSFLVVTNNYRASGGGGFPGCDGTSVVIEAPDANRDVVLKYVASRTEIAPKSDGNWRFAPWPSTVVATYLTSPAASGLSAPPGLKLTSMGVSAGRFLEVARRDGVNGPAGSAVTALKTWLAPRCRPTSRASSDRETSLGAATAPVATPAATLIAPLVNVPSDSTRPALGVAERLTLRQSLPDRADDFAAGEFAVIGEVAGGHAGQVNDLHPALLEDRAIGLLGWIERAEARRIAREKA